MANPEPSTPLSQTERRQIAWRLGPLLFGGALLLLSFWIARRPGQEELVAATRALAAVIVALPIVTRCLIGLFRPSERDVTSQLVSLAVLAAIAAGDFITATLVPLLMEFGRLFEDRSSRGVRAAIDGLRRLHARRARRLVAGEEQDVDPSNIQPGDLVVVHPGEIIPVDGEVVSGHSSVDQSPITGESRYEDVAPASSVYAGSVNLDGLLRIRTGEVGSESVLGRVSGLLREVEASKTPALRLIERVITVYLPMILAIAAVTLFVTGNLSRAIAVLVVACPSALFLCGPVAIVAALTACTRVQVLIKSAGFLEQVARVRTLVFDKTGTVTVGAMSLQDVHLEPSEPCPSSSKPSPASNQPKISSLQPDESVAVLETMTESDLIATAAIGARGSLHPVSRAIVAEAERRGISIAEADSVQEVPGQGVVATCNGERIRVGRSAWLCELGVSIPERDNDGPAVVTWVARGEQVIGRLTFEDRPREEAKQALEAVRRLGIDRLVLLTGDRRDISQRICDELQFDELFADVLPEQKLELVRREQERAPVMMIGDGVNDALALSGADVGVAVGSRINEIALGGADVALMTDDLDRLPLMMRLARFTRRLVVQNLILVALTSLTLIILAATGTISPLTGAWLHNIDAVLVILNSSRILSYAEQEGIPWRGIDPPAR